MLGVFRKQGKGRQLWLEQMKQKESGTKSCRVFEKLLCCVMES